MKWVLLVGMKDATILLSYLCPCSLHCGFYKTFLDLQAQDGLKAKTPAVLLSAFMDYHATKFLGQSLLKRKILWADTDKTLLGSVSACMYGKLLMPTKWLNTDKYMAAALDTGTPHWAELLSAYSPKKTRLHLSYEYCRFSLMVFKCSVLKGSIPL